MTFRCAGCRQELTPNRFSPSHLRRVESQKAGRCTQCVREYEASRKVLCGCGNLMTHKSQTCSQCKYINQKGCLSSSWKGGRRKNSNGYILVSNHDHLHRQKGNVIPEHRLVMEEHRGRYLYPHEEVHHKNGIRHDNRIENLELWNTSQPAGQRVEDKIAWCKEFMAQYE